MSTSLDVPDVKPCPFCDYLSGARPFTILTRSSSIAILVTREQRGIGHLLVVPVAHRPTLLELNEVEAPAMMDAVIVAAKAITNAYQPKGLAVWQNNGVPANQAIPHVHFHIAGTLPGGGTEWKGVEEIPVVETEAIAGKLRPYIS